MGRPRVIRTPEEEEIYQNNRRIHRNEMARRRRQTARQFITDISRDLERIRQNTEDYLGPMNINCIHCNAKHFVNEKVANKGLSFNDCCSHGSVILETLPDFPVELKLLFNGEHEKSNHFFERIRHYNNSLSFASFNANLVNFQTRRSGPFCFKIQGQIYYQINTTLYPCDGENPSYGQLFIIDQSEAVDYRINSNPVIDYQLMSALDSIIRNNNIFAKSYAMMKEELNAQILSNNNASPHELQLLFSLKAGQDTRRFNFQRANEVAAIFSTTADGEIPESYVTIRNAATKSLQCVSSLDPNVEPWIYPLFFPYGNQGWHHNMTSINTVNNSNRHVTRLAYSRYRLAIRDDEFNPFIRGRRLFQQYVVDNYVKIEKDRIQYCKDHQKELRVDSYQGLQDYMSMCASDVGGNVGKTVILPSTFIGSPRHMQQCYQDAMAIVNAKGRPDIFLTMTCNPNWNEIKENLLPGQ